MHNDTNKHHFPSLIEDVLSHPGQCVDNVFAGVWNGLKLNKLIQRSGFKKRTGIPVTDAVFLLLLWKWIDVSSIAVFAKRSLKTFSEAKKDVMYDLLKREDVDWRSLNAGGAKEVYQRQKVASSRLRVYVLDDSVKYGVVKKWRAYPATLIIPKVVTSWGSRY